MIDLAKLSHMLEEFIGCARQLSLEESQPENLSQRRSLQEIHNFGSQIVVQNILEIDKIKLISPRVEH
jgi:hypothetical protein